MCTCVTIHSDNNINNNKKHLNACIFCLHSGRRGKHGVDENGHSLNEPFEGIVDYNSWRKIARYLSLCLSISSVCVVFVDSVLAGLLRLVHGSCRFFLFLSLSTGLRLLATLLVPFTYIYHSNALTLISILTTQYSISSANMRGAK